MPSLFGNKIMVIIIFLVFPKNFKINSSKKLCLETEMNLSFQLLYEPNRRVTSRLHL